MPLLLRQLKKNYQTKAIKNLLNLTLPGECSTYHMMKSTRLHHTIKSARLHHTMKRHVCIIRWNFQPGVEWSTSKNSLAVA